MRLHGRRHFQYEHPTFGTKSRPKNEASWKHSVYFWWWQYLRQSDRYRRTCAENGAGELAELYAAFGDVRNDDFKAWWTEGERGASLFGEPPSDVVRVVDLASEVVPNGTVLIVSFPLSLPKRYLQRRFKEVLAKHHLGRRGHQMARRSQAKFQVSGQPNVPALETGLAVYDFWKANPKMPLWEVGHRLPKLQMDNKLVASDPPPVRVAKKNVLAATVSRYLRRVKRSIEATERGKFP